MRNAWSALDAKKLAAVVKRDLASPDMTIAIVAKDGAALKKLLVSGAKTPPSYEAPKPKEITDEDRVIEAEPLGLKDEDVKVIPVADLFAK